jgi:stalled ribosome rescue protein Dom34
MPLKVRAIIWIDHAQARVIKFDAETSVTQVVRPEGGTPHLHHKAKAIDDGHEPENQTYYHSVGKTLDGINAVLVTGPANAKTELMKHLARHDPPLLKKVSAIQTVDHPTDGQLLDLARHHFGLIDRGLVPPST